MSDHVRREVPDDAGRDVETEANRNPEALHVMPMAELTQDQEAYLAELRRSVEHLDADVVVGGPRILPTTNTGRPL